MILAKRKFKAFTLVELLVVIGIIALLISVLLPALNKARKAATTLACMANLRSIGQGMQLYASEQHGYIVGSPDTSGAFLSQPGFGEFNCPEICQNWDWQSPVAKIMKANFNHNSSLPDRTQRFLTLCNYPPFVCPENDIISPPFTGPPTGSPIQISTRMISYNTAAFMLQASSFLGNASGYSPKITKVGITSQKIFMSDGGRWSMGGVPDSNETFLASVNANDYADFGAMDAFSRAFYNSTTMLYSMRHGARKPGLSAGSYKFNAVFFDGHAETLDGRTGMNPQLWIPKGSTVATPGTEFSAQAIAAYGINTGQAYQVRN